MNPYKILKIKSDVTEKEIKSAYRTLVKKYHPDMNPDNREKAKEKFLEVQAAYEYLEQKGFKVESNINYKSPFEDLLNRVRKDKEDAQNKYSDYIKNARELKNKKKAKIKKLDKNIFIRLAIWKSRRPEVILITFGFFGWMLGELFNFGGFIILGSYLIYSMIMSIIYSLTRNKIHNARSF